MGGVALQQAEHARGPVDLLALEAPRLLPDQGAYLRFLPLEQQQFEVSPGELRGQLAGDERLLQQRQRPLRLLRLQPQPGQPHQRLAAGGQRDGAMEGRFGPLRLPLLHRQAALQAPQLGFARAQRPVGMAAQGLLPNPQGLAVLATGHQVADLALQCVGIAARIRGLRRIAWGACRRGVGGRCCRTTAGHRWGRLRPFKPKFGASPHPGERIEILPAAFRVFFQPRASCLCCGKRGSASSTTRPAGHASRDPVSDTMCMALLVLFALLPWLRRNC